MSAVSDVELVGVERARRARYETLQRLGAALTRAATAHDVASAVVREGCAGLGAKTAGMWLGDERGDALVLVASQGYPPDMQRAFARVEVSSALPIADAVRRREPLWFESRAQYRREYPEVEPQTRGFNDARDLAFVCVPLVVEGRALGCLSFVFDVDRTFDDDERHFVWMLSQQSAQAVARAASFDREQRSRRLVENLQAVTAALSEAITPAEIARALVDRAVDAFGARLGGVWVREGDHARALYDRGLGDTHVGYRTIPLDADLPPCDVFRTGEPRIVGSLEDCERAYPRVAQMVRELGLRHYALVALPLRSRAERDRVAGVMVLTFDDGRTLRDDEIRTLEALARQCEVALARANAHDRARREERRFRTLVVASAQVVFSTDAQGWATEPSPSWCAFTGQSGEDFRRAHGLDAVHPDDVPRVEAAWHAAIARGTPFDLEYRLRRHDGAFVPVVARATPVVDDDGVIREWIGTITDVTAQKQAEEARERSSERLRVMQRVTAELSQAATRGEIGRIFLRHALSAFGASSGRLSALGSDGSFELIASEGTGDALARAVARLRGDEPFPLCVALRRGTPVWLGSPDEVAGAFPESVRGALGVCEALVALPLSSHELVVGGVVLQFARRRSFDDDEREHLMALSAQCAQALERARLYEAERRSNEHLRILAEASARLASTLEYDATLRNVVELVVPAFADFAFFDVVERDGSVRRTPYARDPAKQAILDASRWVRSERTDINLCALSSGQTGFHPVIDDAFLRNMAASPEHLEVLRRLELCAMLTVPFVTRGELVGALTLCMGESRRRYEESDVTTVEDLARRAAMAVDNARLLAESREGVRVRDEFLSIAGHELNTPIAALKMQLHGIRRSAGLSEKMLGRLAVAERQVTRLTKLVTQLLDVSRIGAGGLTLEPERFDLLQLVREVVERFAEESERTGSVISLQGEPLFGEWDRLRIDQVVTNLVGNALKYGRGRPIEVRVERREGAARLVVKDQGIGIEEDKLQRIFERFERAVSRNYGGFGLGLWISRRIVEAASGRVRVESKLDVGSTFEVELPLASGDPPA